MKQFLFFVHAVVVAGITVPSAGLSQEKDANILLQRAVDAVGIQKAKNKVLHFNVVDAFMQFAQSDRMYPPYYPIINSSETWYNSMTGTARTSTSVTFFGSGPTKPSTSIVGRASSVMIRDSLVFPAGRDPDRMNPWTVLMDWMGSEELRYKGREVYREYPREVISRKGKHADERLFLDPKSGLPVKLDLVEPHYLLGQVHVEYLYATWIQVENVFVPSMSCRIVDGEPEVYRTVGQTELIAPETAPSMKIPPANRPAMPSSPLGIISSPQPDTVQISATTFLTRNRFYTEGVTLVDDTVYIFDATLGEERARQDSAWIAKAFPGNHHVVVVVTDLAWPHISGVRYWVSRGATIVSHRMSEQFLRKVIDRPWTLNPDELERKRAKAKFKFIGVEGERSMADGKVKLYAIDGLGSEGALMAYLPDEKFLWAGDYIQNNRVPTAYATEVWRAVARVGIRPDRVAAQHLPVTNWSTIDSLSNPPFDRDDKYSLPYPIGTEYELIQGNNGPWGHSGHAAYSFDFLMPIGTHVTAARAGMVVKVVEQFKDGNKAPGEENLIVIRHADSTFARYYHLTKDGALVKIGQEVARGDTIALSGNTGASAGPHLHFDVTIKCFAWGCNTIPLTFENVSSQLIETKKKYKALPHRRQK